MTDSAKTQRIPTAGRMQHVTYEKAFQLIKSHEHALREAKFDLILGIARSGVVPAAMLSQSIDVPVAFLQCNRTDPAPYLLSPVELKGKKVLVVDDIIGLGHTMRRCMEFVQNAGATPSSFCLYYDEQTTSLRPDYGYSTSNYMHAQWDRKDVTPQSRRILAEKNGRCAPGDFIECYGTDLDGILLDDINRKTYRPETRIQSVLAFRDTMPPLNNLPVADHPDLVVVTARPQMDFDRTRTWLDANGFPQVQLICRDESRYGLGAKEAARFKADQIVSIGISKYFESDLLQATLIAQAAPCSDIYWWGKEDKLRIYANAVTSF